MRNKSIARVAANVLSAALVALMSSANAGISKAPFTPPGQRAPHVGESKSLDLKGSRSVRSVAIPNAAKAELIFQNATSLPPALIDANGIHDCKDWKDYEIEAVAKVYAQLPRDFRKNALESAGGPIVFIRAREKDNGAFAAARFNTVCVFDRSFSKWDRLGDHFLKRTIAHELSHIIDFGCRYSLSVDWIKLVHPYLLKYAHRIKDAESDNERNQESIRQGFTQTPDSYCEILIGLVGSTLVEDDYYTIAPDIKSYLVKNFLTRKNLSAGDRKKRELARTRARLLECDKPNYAAADRLMAQNDSLSWFFPIEIRREIGVYGDLENNLQTYNLMQTELVRMNKLGLDDSDPLKKDVLISLGRIACRMDHVDAGKSFFARACPTKEELVTTYEKIVPNENYQTTLAFSKLFWEKAPDKMPDYFAEASALIQSGNVNGAIDALQKTRDYLNKNNKEEAIANSLTTERAALLFDVGRVNEAQLEIKKATQYAVAHKKAKSWAVTKLAPSILHPDPSLPPMKCPTGLGRITSTGSHNVIGYMELRKNEKTKTIGCDIYWDDFASVPINTEISTFNAHFEGPVIKNTLVLAGPEGTLNRLRILSPTKMEFYPSTAKVMVDFESPKTQHAPIKVSKKR